MRHVLIAVVMASAALAAHPASATKMCQWSRCDLYATCVGPGTPEPGTFHSCGYESQSPNRQLFQQQCCTTLPNPPKPKEQQGSITSDKGYGVSPNYLCWKDCMKGRDQTMASKAICTAKCKSVPN